MAVTDEQFAALVKQLETVAQRQPGLYRWRVGWLAILGYAYLFGLIGGLLVLCVLSTALIIQTGVIHPKLFIIPLLFLIPVWVLCKALWIKLPAPEGKRVNRRQAPELFALLDDLSRSLKAPRFNRVLLDQDFNAGVCQIPRLGLLGWSTNYLLLGLPLMQSLSPEQFRAVLAHEMGHLSGNHARFSNWIYRIRVTWGQVLHHFERSNSQSMLWIVNRFLNWYVPFFNAYSFVLARMNEYEADRAAATIAGTQTCAEALVAVKLKSPQVNDYWETISDRVRDLKTPPPAYSELMVALRQPTTATSTKMALVTAFEQQTDLADTHPCLRDRLNALGFNIQEPTDLPIPEKVATTAADRFLGPTLQTILAQYDQDWQSEMAQKWEVQHQYLQSQHDRLTELQQRQSITGLTSQEQWEQAYRTLEVHGGAAAFPLMQAFLELRPLHPAANYNVGALLLKQGDAAGVDYLRTAIERRYDWLEDGCQLIYQFWCDRDEPEQATTWQTYYQERSSQLGLAEHERVRISSHDRFLPHSFDPEQLAALRRQMRQYKHVAQVYLARKVVKQFPDDQLFVVGVVLQATQPARTVETEDALLEAFELDVELGGRQRVLWLNGAAMQRRDLQQVLAAQGALVYEAD
jgi:Zn-dependent protease with chaperone function